MEAPTTWAMEVRKRLFAVAQMTDTPLPDAKIQNTYIKLIHECITGGPHSLTLLAHATVSLVKEWKWPSYPKPADFLTYINRARMDPAFIEEVSEQRTDRLLAEEVVDNNPAEKGKMIDIQKRWREETGGLDYKVLIAMMKEAGFETDV